MRIVWRASRGLRGGARSLVEPVSMAGFPCNRERTGNFKRKRPRGENLWRFPAIKSMACRRNPCAQEQGIRATRAGKEYRRIRDSPRAISDYQGSAENE